MDQINVDMKPGIVAVVKKQLEPIEKRLFELERIVAEQQAEIDRLRAAK